MTTTTEKYLGDKAEYLLGFKNPKIAKERLHLPGPDFVDRVFAPSDRNNRVLGNLQRLYGTGRWAGSPRRLSRAPAQTTSPVDPRQLEGTSQAATQLLLQPR